MNINKRFYATWLVSEIPTNLDDFHISCGVGDDQYEGYFINDKDVILRITSLGNNEFAIRLSVPTLDLELKKGYWISPNQVGNYDAIFGVEDE